MHEEWIGNLIINRPDLKAADLDRTRMLMNRAVPDCLVAGYEPLMSGLDLPDPDDRHVVAAAILTRANVIVTFNLKDFPAAALEQFRLHARHPDDFLVEAFSLAPSVFVDAVARDFLHYGNPPLVFEDYLESLRKAGVPGLARRLQPLAVLMRRDGGRERVPGDGGPPPA